MIRWMAAAMLLGSAGWAAELPGRYVLNVMEVASELMLKPDGGFEYVFVYGAADYQAKGTWKHEGDSVVLNTATSSAPAFRVMSSSKGDPNEFRVFVKAPNGRGVQHIDVAVETADGTLKERTDSAGAATFPEVKQVRAVKLHVPVYDVDAGPFPVDGQQHEMTFEINGEAITRVPFKDEHLKVGPGTLEMRFWNKDRPMVYRKS